MARPAANGTRATELEALLCEGHSYKEIAARMHIAEGTVKVYTHFFLGLRGHTTRIEFMAARIAELNEKLARLEGSK